MVKQTILLVDDEAEIREGLRIIVAASGQAQQLIRFLRFGR